ncbi:hypothetical protein CEP49_08540 [Mergibacter septicus]|uniref:DNA (cytosine-5-)-methyltransferase n=1 Tax=Mergibacter septicus TaxID=221402 RepID=UPI00117956C8|nr:DNA (cytosine-5-)-methyltransferase [Mergibacter septicus]AWX14563.1 hypothetical protein CEP49_08540 [Mergibacter septicus]
MRFFDFCSGIGGGRIGLEMNGLSCVGHCEIDGKADSTYRLFFNDNRNYGDLTKVDIETLPEFDFMIAGFPCQTFSIVGKRKGFEDKRGQIIYSLMQILKKRKIKYFLLENVKGLVNHDKGNTLRTIINELECCGYNVFWKVLNSAEYGVPQMRERVYIVGFRSDLKITKYSFPNSIKQDYNFEDYLDKENELNLEHDNKTFLKYLANKYNENRYSIEEILSLKNQVIDWRQSDLRIYDEIFPTLRTGRHGILYVKNGELKKLNGYESLLLQGFPREIAIKVKEEKLNNNMILSQAGNAMTATVIREIAKNMLKVKNGDKEMDKVELGSNTARNGFKNEQDVADKFNNWQTDIEAREWLKIMQYNLDNIEYVKAVVISGFKADINVKVQIKLKDALDVENIQVKLVSNKKGFNQIDKRWLSSYNILWNIPEDVYKILEYFTGEIPPYRENTKDKRRMFITEFTEEEQDKLISWIDENKILIVTDILKGRGEFCAEWVLVAQKIDKNARWTLKNINEVIKHYYSDGSITISPRGSIKLGRVTIQRKGGDGGRPTANMLQFKIDPTELFD